MENKNDIGKIIKEKLSQLDKNPNDNLWDKIEKDLNTRDKKNMFLNNVSYFALGLIISFLFFNFFTSNLFREPESITIEKSTLQDADEILGAKKIISKNKTKISETNDYIIYEECITYKIENKNNSTEKNTLTETYQNVDELNIKHKPTETEKSVTYKQTLKITNPTVKNKVHTEVVVSDNNNNKKGTSDSSEIEFLSRILNQEDFLTIQSDSTIVNTLDEKINLKKKKEKNLEEETKKEKKIINEKQISVFYGPTFFNSLSKGSSINASLKQNTKTTHVEDTYGAYFSKYFGFSGFRIGLVNTKLSYNTVINKRTNGNFPISFSNIDLIEGLENSSIDMQFSNTDIINLRQSISYVQFPIEIYKTIYGIENKFKINIIAGITPEILVKNNLSVYDKEGTNELVLGKSSNLNKVNLSSQIGLGFVYKLTEKIHFQCDPIFKYQVIPYKEYYRFTPYYLTIQTGIGYTF